MDAGVRMGTAGTRTFFGFAPAQAAALVVLLLTPGTFTIVGWFREGAILHYSIPVVVAQAGLIGCCLLGGLDVAATFRSARPAALVAAAGLILTGLLGTALVATIPSAAAIHLAVTTVELMLGFCLWGVFSSGWTELRRPAMVALAVGILYQVALAYWYAVSVRHAPNFDWVHFRAGTTHVRQLGFYGTALCGLAAGMLATGTSTRGQAGAFVLATVGFAWNDLSGGRAAFAAGIGGALLVWFLAPKERRRQLAWLLAGAFFLAAPLSAIFIPHPMWGLPEILGRLFGFHTVREFTSGRTQMWIGALKGFLASPLIGHGEGQFRQEVTHGLWNHPHDSLLQLLYQWGIIGTACVFVIAGPILARITRAARADPHVALPAAGALVGLLLMSLLEGSLYHVFPVMVVVMCLAVLASVPTNAKPA